MTKKLTIKNIHLPDGWEEAKWKEILHIRSGRSHKEVLDPDGNYPIIGSAGKVMGYANTYLCEANTTIIGRKGTINNPIFITTKFWNVDTAFGLQVGEKLISKFLYYFCKSFDFTKMDKGSGRPSLVKSDLLQIKMSFPSIVKQKQIVTSIEKAFALIEKAKANSEQNLQNAKELFESYLQNVFKNKGDDWEEKPLSKVTTKIGSGATPRGGKASYKEEGVSLIRSMNVHDFEFKEKNLAFIDEQQASALSNVTIQEEDILLNITGASIARCCIVPKQFMPARVNQHVSIIRAKKEIISPVFLASLLTSKFFKDQILEIGEQGATRQAITKVQLERFVISFPKDIKKQKAVIKKIDALSSSTKKLESIYAQKITDLEEMKKSILQKAFSGELNTLN